MSKDGVKAEHLRATANADQEISSKSGRKARMKQLHRQQLSVNSMAKQNEKKGKADVRCSGNKIIKPKVQFSVGERIERTTDEGLIVKRFTRPRNSSWKEKSVFARNYGFKPAAHAIKPTTNYLEMLKISPQGIFDIDNMKSKTSSTWVEKWITQIRCSKDLNEENIHESLQLIQGPKLNVTMKSEKENININPLQLPKIVINDCSVSFLENETVEPKKIRRKSKDYGSVYCLLFALEYEEKLRDFPKFTLLEIAESLNETTDIEQVEFIQKRRKRWEIVVRGDETKEQLLNNGLVVKGRWYALVEDPFFKEYYTKEVATALHTANNIERWQCPRRTSLVDI